MEFVGGVPNGEPIGGGEAPESASEPGADWEKRVEKGKGACGEEILQKAEERSLQEADDEEGKKDRQHDDPF